MGERVWLGSLGLVGACWLGWGSAAQADLGEGGGMVEVDRLFDQPVRVEVKHTATADIDRPAGGWNTRPVAVVRSADHGVEKDDVVCVMQRGHLGREVGKRLEEPGEQLLDGCRAVARGAEGHDVIVCL